MHLNLTMITFLKTYFVLYILSLLIFYTSANLNSFLTTWNTSEPGISASNEIQLPLRDSGVYNFTVEWGDGTSDKIMAWDQAETTHQFSSSGTYSINITGTIRGWKMFEGDAEKLLEISQWGSLDFYNLNSIFNGKCSSYHAIHIYH